MKKISSFNDYFDLVENGQEIMLILRNILIQTELTETIKWGVPTYTLNSKNVVGLAAFKSYVGLWFHQGAFLADKAGVLTNANKEKTRGLRQWRFNNVSDIDEKLVLSYIQEAIKNQREGKEIKVQQNKTVTIPIELQEYFDKDFSLRTLFESFTPGKQREFAEYISEAKRKETKLSRIQKIIPLIQQNIGLNDKYRK